MIEISTLNVDSVIFSPKRQIYQVKEIKVNDFVLLSWRTSAVFTIAKQKQNAFWKNAFVLHEGNEIAVYDQHEVDDECAQNGISIYPTTRFFINTLDAKDKKIIVSVLDNSMNISATLSLFPEDFSMLFSPKNSVGEEEPKNNDGLEFCFWCKGATKKQGWFFKFHNICSVCKK